MRGIFPEQGDETGVGLDTVQGGELGAGLLLQQEHGVAERCAHIDHDHRPPRGASHLPHEFDDGPVEIGE